VVTRAALEAQLERVRATVAEPRAGIFGPGSPTWRLQRESIAFLGGGRAALLQLAHPYVAHGVDQHSATRTDAIGRFRRTFMNVFAMTFGPLDDAFRAARRVHNIHLRVTGAIPEAIGSFAAGARYHANDVAALRWVYATLMHTVVQVHELVVRPLPLAEKDDYYRDTRRFAALFGLSEAQLPADWSGFDAYFEETVASPEIAVCAAARDMAGFLFRPPQPTHAPLAAWMKTVTTALLPDKVRRGFGLPWGLRERALFRTSIAALRPVYRTLPQQVRYLPAYIEASRRLDGQPPSPIAHFMDRLMLWGVGGRKALRSI
jgi:uncharacterized protein (DUF2236 family)